MTTASFVGERGAATTAMIGTRPAQDKAPTCAKKTQRLTLGSAKPTVTEQLSESNDPVKSTPFPNPALLRYRPKCKVLFPSRVNLARSAPPPQRLHTSVRNGRARGSPHWR